MGCPSCGRGWHEECINCELCHGEADQLKLTLISESRGLGAPIKNPEDVRDPKSTGRKRAAVHYPLFRDQPCEWRGLKNVGGGLKPSVGCMQGLQQHRHHGPNKNTLSNEPGNIHRICNNCHSAWHALNNPIYDEEQYKRLPHSPQEATTEELLAEEAARSLRKSGIVIDWDKDD